MAVAKDFASPEGIHTGAVGLTKGDMDMVGVGVLWEGLHAGKLCVKGSQYRKATRNGSLQACVTEGQSHPCAAIL